MPRVGQNLARSAASVIGVRQRGKRVLGVGAVLLLAGTIGGIGLWRRRW